LAEKRFVWKCKQKQRYISKKIVRKVFILQELSTGFSNVLNVVIQKRLFLNQNTVHNKQVSASFYIVFLDYSLQTS